MNCQDIELLMADAWGQEISRADQADLDDHLRSCERCRVEYATGCRALAAMSELRGPARVSVERTGDTLVLRDVACGNLRRTAAPLAWWARSAFRYAASVLIAFVSGYALHSGLMIADRWGENSSDRVIVSVTPDDAQSVKTGIPTAPSVEGALRSAHHRYPRGSRLAKCMIAMFPAGG